MKRIFTTFIILSIFMFFLSFAHYSILNLKELELNYSNDNITQVKSEYFNSKATKITFSNLINIPVKIIIEINVISVFIYFCCFLFNFKIPYKEVLYITLKTNFIFLFSIVYEIIHFKFFNPVYTIIDIGYFSSLSVLTIIGYKNLESWFIYPLQTLNLFEVGYCLLLAYYIGKSTRSNIRIGLKIVALSYIPGLILWVILIMSLTLNNS